MFKNIFTVFACLLMLTSFCFADTRLFAANMETGDLSEWTRTDVSGAGVSLAYTDLNQYNGLGSMRATLASVAGRAYAHKIISSSKYFYMQVCLKTALTSGYLSYKNQIQGYNGGVSTARFIVKLASVAGYASNRIAISLVDDEQTIATNLPLDTLTSVGWLVIDAFEGASTTGLEDGKFRLWLNGVLFYSNDTLDNDTNMPDSIIVGAQTGVGDGGIIDYDAIVIDSMPCLPPCGLVYRYVDDNIYNKVMTLFR